MSNPIYLEASHIQSVELTVGSQAHRIVIEHLGLLPDAEPARGSGRDQQQNSLERASVDHRRAPCVAEATTLLRIVLPNCTTKTRARRGSVSDVDALICQPDPYRFGRLRRSESAFCGAPSVGRRPQDARPDTARICNPPDDSRRANDEDSVFRMTSLRALSRLECGPEPAHCEAI